MDHAKINRPLPARPRSPSGELAEDQQLVINVHVHLTEELLGRK